MKETRMIARVSNLDCVEVDSVIIYLTVTQKTIGQCLFAMRMAAELEHPDNGCGPAEVAITVPALVYEGHLLDDKLRDELWDEYEGRVVDDFPDIEEEPIAKSVQLLVITPVSGNRCKSTECIWVRHYNYETPDTFTQPLGRLSETVSERFLMFQQKRSEQEAMTVSENEKLVFFIPSTSYEELDEDECEAGCLTLHFTISSQVRKALLAGLTRLNDLEKRERIGASLSVEVPCAVYNTVEERFFTSFREKLEKYRHGVLVEQFPTPPKGHIWGGENYSVSLTISLPEADVTEQSPIINISYESQPVSRWETNSSYLNNLARQMLEMLA
jgi:hypothetical protein